MSISKRNPLLRNSEEKEYDNSVGSLNNEIMHQDLEGVSGGTTWFCGGVAVGALTLGLFNTGYNIGRDMAKNGW